MRRKNLIKVLVSKGLLYLSIPSKYYPKNKYFLGLPDEPQYRVIANQLAFVMGVDCAAGSFDPTLAKYKTKLEYIGLVELWELYCNFKRTYLMPSSVRIFITISNHLKTIEPEILVNIPALKIYLMNNLSQEQSRRVIMHLQAACSWGVEMGFIPNNPFKKLAPISRIRNKQIDPFSKQEMNMILTGFAGHEYYYYYQDFVRFLFLTGCRPSEAIALTWEFIAYDFSKITFKNVIVERKKKNIPKNRQIRHFPINKQLKLLLERIPKRHDYIFPSPRGTYINLNNFNRRAWHSVLRDLPIRYRPLYNCRHSFITWCLRDGIHVATVAQWVGNTPKIIWEYYAGFIDDEVPLI